jgi:integrase
MVLAGLRGSELSALRWSGVDLANGRLHVETSKTDAGRRTVDLSPDLRDELLAHKAKAGVVDPAGFVFATRNGTARQRSNVTRQRREHARSHRRRYRPASRRSPSVLTWQAAAPQFSAPTSRAWAIRHG